MCKDRSIDTTASQTDASRAKTIEIQVQARVAEELKKLQKKESEALSIAHEKLAAAAAASKDDDSSKNTSTSFTVAKEVDNLRHKLDGRKTLRAVPESVEKARAEVVLCLRGNDRRPLDCWEVVEKFKAEVRKMEQGWVDKATS
jgi:altered-inheritance-of-mitochondria protein 13